MADLADVSNGDLITAARQNDINDYIHDGTHKLNTLSLEIQGTEVIDSSRNVDCEILTVNADAEFQGNQAKDLVVHNVADATARDALTPVLGKVVYQVDEGRLYVCVEE